MECQTCQTSNPAGQRFCGACGHNLESECAQCGALNPPQYKFCGECGAPLAMDGAFTLARSGLITQVDQKTADLLGRQRSELLGKPFTLFVDRVDMVIFFSHWNELLSNAKKQSFELALKHKENKNIYVSLECSVGNRNTGATSEYLIVLNEVSENRLIPAQLQYQEDLLGLIFSTAGNIRSVTANHLEHALTDALKKICLFAKADRCFIFSINRSSRCLELAYQWRQPSSAPADDNATPTCIPLRQMKRAMVRFLQEQAYIVNDMAELPPAERDELQAWHQAELGAVICHLIHSQTQPIGIIGVAKDSADEAWPADCVALIKFFGQIVSDKLPMAALEVHTKDDADLAPEQTQPLKKDAETKIPDKAIPAGKSPSKPPAAPRAVETASVENRPSTQPRNLPDMSRPMLLEKLTGQKPEDQQTVFPRDDGVVLLTCPRCSHQESVLVGWFERLGNAISVNCPCKKQFAAVLEKRRAFRKSVKLAGFFSLKSDLEQKGSHDSIWGSMVVRDLSKSGLRFSSDRSGLVHTGDLLMVRFNLDNTNQALIHKPAKVIAVNGDQVGCQFEGDDSYDITLGFYFI